MANLNLIINSLFKMKNFLIANGNWGESHLRADINKIDVLPRFTISNTLGNTHIKLAFLMLTFELIFYGNEMRDFLRKLKSGEIQKEIEQMQRDIDEKIAKLRKLANTQVQNDDNIKHISEVVDEIMVELKAQKNDTVRKRSSKIKTTAERDRQGTM